MRILLLVMSACLLYLGLYFDTIDTGIIAVIGGIGFAYWSISTYLKSEKER